MKTLITLLALFGLVTACSSTPKKVATLDQSERQDYIESVNDRLEDIEDDLDDVSAAEASSLRAFMKDTRAELTDLENATGDKWITHRDRIENNLGRMEARVKAAE